MPKLPQSIGPFKILQSLGRGGTSQVYKALHPNLKKEVVLKKLTLKGAGPVKERFQREAELMMGFNHPHIVKVYDIFKEGSSWIIVQEFIDGPNLEEYVHRKGPLGKAGSLRVVLQCLKALGYIHRRGIVHRDIKPSNIFLTAKGDVKLGDFGIASRLDGGKGLTREGAALGTPDFMAPEQALNPSDVDGRADLYALALTWYEAWTGEPWPRKGPPARAVRFSLSGRILKKGARKRRAFRYPSAGAMLLAVRLWLFPLLWSSSDSAGSDPPPSDKAGSGKNGGTKRTPRPKRKTPALWLIPLLPLLLWGFSQGYYRFLKEDLYGSFSLAVPYGEDTAPWYLKEARVTLYRYGENGPERLRRLLLVNRKSQYRLASRSLFLAGGGYALRFSLPDREEWLSFFLGPGGKEILWEELNHPPEEPEIRVAVFDILTGEELPRAEWKAPEGLPSRPGESRVLIMGAPGYRELTLPVKKNRGQDEIRLRAGLLPLPARVVVKYGFAPENPSWTVPVRVDGSNSYLSWEDPPRWARPVLEGTEAVLLLSPGPRSLEIFSPRGESRFIELDLAPGEVKTLYVE